MGSLDYLSVCIGFLIGTATGAAGTYFGNKYTDKRKIKENKNEIEDFYKNLWKMHKPLLSEMKVDMENPDLTFHREFFILSRSWGFNHAGKFIGYYLEEHDQLEQQIRKFEAQGLVSDITEFGKNVKKYQFSEFFVEQLLEK